MDAYMKLKTDLSEIVDYDILQYPIYIRRGFLSGYYNYSAVSHWHDDIELIYILSGTMQYDVNGEIVTLSTGEGILVNSRQFHYGFSTEKKECEFICILIHPSILSSNGYVYDYYVQPFMNCERLAYMCLTPEVPWQQTILNNMKSLSDLDKKAQSFVLRCQQYIFQMFTLLYEHVENILSLDSKTDTSLFQLREMVSFIEHHYKEAVSLRDISRAGNVGKTSCCAIFKKYMHTTPVEYLINYRLERSVRLIMETDLPITEISFEVGFRNTSYYTKIFHEYYGKTPTRMRKGKG